MIRREMPAWPSVPGGFNHAVFRREGLANDTPCPSRVGSGVGLISLSSQKLFDYKSC